ncbi:MAG: tetratricopeptide repeat protein [Bacteroidia bacterium]|nr:tetratricopeptide repeat protein [Bacteroidia bacterium]
MKVPHWILVCLLFLRTTAFAQQTEADSLYAAAYQLRYENSALSLSLFEQAEQVAREAGNTKIEALSNQQMASIYYRGGQFGAAVSRYQQALEINQRIGNAKAVADIEVALATAFFAQGKLSQATTLYLEALRYFDQVNDKPGQIAAWNALATIYSRQNNFSKSIEYTLKAIRLYEASSDKFRVLVGYDQIGNAYLRQQNLIKAKEAFLKSLKLYTDLDNKAGVAATLLQLGNIAYQRKQYAEALQYYNKAVVLANKMQAKALLVSAYNALGKVHQKLKAYDESIQSFNKAIVLAKLTEQKIELEEAYQGLAQVYAITNEQAKSSTFGLLSKELKDSLYNDSMLKGLNDQLLVFESEKKQQQIELLRKEQLLQEVELKRERERQQNYNVFGVILMSLIVLLLFFLFQYARTAKSLKRQQAELLEKNASILQQKEDLTQLNKVKDRFFSIISHDLRNSLTTMKLYFDLMSNPNYVPENNAEMSRQISGAVENTIDLLENLLVWASAQIKGVTIHIQPLNMHRVASDTIQLLNGTAHQKSISLNNALPENLYALGDADMIHLILRNLVSNAIKFTPEGGSVMVFGNETQDMVTIEVKDNGVGIQENALKTLFDQHLHPSTKGTGNEKGTGLGLLLCKDFIERNGGTISVTSRKGEGTSFFITLPVHRHSV